MTISDGVTLSNRGAEEARPMTREEIIKGAEENYAAAVKELEAFDEVDQRVRFWSKVIRLLSGKSVAGPGRPKKNTPSPRGEQSGVSIIKKLLQDNPDGLTLAHMSVELFRQGRTSKSAATNALHQLKNELIGTGQSFEVTGTGKERIYRWSVTTSKPRHHSASASASPKARAPSHKKAQAS